jgi:hypothetical protein
LRYARDGPVSDGQSRGGLGCATVRARSG